MSLNYEKIVINRDQSHASYDESCVSSQYYRQVCHKAGEARSEQGCQIDNDVEHDSEGDCGNRGYQKDNSRRSPNTCCDQWRTSGGSKMRKDELTDAGSHDPKDRIPERPLTLFASTLWFAVATSFTITLMIASRAVGGGRIDLVTAIGCQAAGYLLTMWLVLRFHRVSRSLIDVFAFRSASVWECVLAVLLGVVLQLPADLLHRIVLRISPVSPESQAASQAMLSMDSVPMKVMIPVVTIVAGPAVEELFYRGVLFRGLRNNYGTSVAVLTVTLLFAIAHESIHLVVPLVFVGLVLTVLRAVSGSIWPSLMAHASFNATAVLVAAFFDDRAASNAGTNGWFVGIGGLVAVVFFLYAFVMVCKQSDVGCRAREEDGI